MSFYDRNMAVLRSVAPSYAEWVASGPDDPHIELIHLPSGARSLRLKSEGKEAYLLYEAPDPLGREREKITKWQAQHPKTTFLFGMGLGYRAAALLEKLPKGHVIFIVEENPAMVKLALSHLSFTAALAANALVFVPPDENALKPFLSCLARPFRKGEVGIMVDENCRRYFSGRFQSTAEQFGVAVKNMAQKEAALIQLSTEVVENEMTNLPLTLLSPGISRFKDILRGVPAIVVSAGPSLANNVHLLPEAVGRAAIIAAAPVLRVLKAYDIQPDLIGILDYTPSNYDVLADVFATEDVPLVFLEATYPRVVRDYQGDLVSVIHSEGPIRYWLGHLLKDHDHWPVGGNVGSFCLDLAVYLGADPIILVGQDLSYPDLTSHSEGIIGRRAVSGGPDSRYIYVESVSGGKVATSLALASYLEEFNQTIRQTGRTFINTSPHGARIAGTLEMSLDEALKIHCRKGFNVRQAVSTSLARPPQSLTDVMDEISGLDAELDALDVVTGKALEINQGIIDLLDNITTPRSEELCRLIQVHTRYCQGARKYCRSFAPLQKYLTSQLALLTDNGELKDQSLDWRTTIESAMTHSRRMLESIRVGGQRLRGLLATAGKNLAEAVEARSIEGRSDPIGLRQAARAWSRLGRLKEAWPFYRAAISAAPDEPELFLEAAEFCLSRERPRLAQELTRTYLDQEPDHAGAKALLARIRTTVDEWMDRAEKAREADDWITALILARKILAFDAENEAARQIEKHCLETRTGRIRAAREKTAELYRSKQVRRLTEQAAEAFGAGRHQDVITLLDGRLSIDREEDHEALVYLGVSLADRGRGAEGLGILRDIHERRPDWAFVAAKLGPVLIKNGYIEPGILMLEKAGRLDKAYASLMYEAGCLCLGSGDYERAMENFQQHLEADPTSHETMNKLAICHLAKGRPKAARHFFERALMIQPESEAARIGLEKCMAGQSPAAAG